mmetsp:Transcript_10292/g.36064  ORF Transcript_10292/g.36064 Transcript_10292/m.36064 type:complete len:228 (-) Transcript_10292:578-1261(-)
MLHQWSSHLPPGNDPLAPALLAVAVPRRERERGGDDSSGAAPRRCRVLGIHRLRLDRQVALRAHACGLGVCNSALVIDREHLDLASPGEGQAWGGVGQGGSGLLRFLDVVLGTGWPWRQHLERPERRQLWCCPQTHFQRRLQQGAAGHDATNVHGLSVPAVDAELALRLPGVGRIHTCGLHHRRRPSLCRVALPLHGALDAARCCLPRQPARSDKVLHALRQRWTVS